MSAALEKVGLDKIGAAFAGGKKPATQLLRQVLGSFLAEGSEEAAEQVAQTIYDELISGTKSARNQAVQQYMNQGMSRQQAEKKAWEGIGSETLQSFIVGGIAGGAMSGAAGVVNNVTDSRLSQNLQQFGLTKEEADSLVKAQRPARQYFAQEPVNTDRVQPVNTEVQNKISQLSNDIGVTTVFDDTLASTENGYYDEMVDFLQGFLSAGLKTNWDNLKFGILTGRLHIPLQSGLDNLDIDDITTTCRYADVFGFTQGEVDRILCEMGLSEKRDVVREWYGGYRLGDKTEVYSPWSTMKYLRDLQAYPALEPESNAHDSSQSFFVKKLFPGEYLEMADGITNLVLGGVLPKWIPRTPTYKNLDSSKNLWAVLYQCGCLTRASEEQMQRLDVSLNPKRDEMALVIPNEEIRTVFWYTVSTWYRDTVNSEQRRALLDAFWQADTESFRNELHSILLKNVKRSEAKASAFSAKALSENFYHGLLAGFFLVGCPKILSFTEASDRIYDLQVLDNRAGRAAIVEVRRAFDEREDLLSLAEKGLKQIEKNRNNARLLSDSSVKTLLHWSIAFCKKSCEAKALIVRHS